MSAPEAGAPTPGERDAIEMLAREASIVALGAEPGEYDKWPHGDATDVPWSTQEDARAIARWVMGREAAARAEGHAAGLEAAARACEQIVSFTPGRGFTITSEPIYRSIPEAIRALAGADQEGARG